MIDLPEGWIAASLGDLVDHSTEGVDPADADGLPYVGLKHMESAAMALFALGDPSTVRSRKMLFAANDILYGKLRPYLDKAALAEGAGICSTDILVLRPRTGVDPYFATALLHTGTFKAHATSTMTGVNHPRTSWSSIKEFDLALPPLPEQRAIAHVLRTVQQAREATEQVIAAARELKQSMMQHLFTYGPVPIDQWDDSNQVDTDAGPLPRRWQLIPLGEVCGFTGGTQPPKRTFAYEPKPGFVRLLQIRDFDTDKHATYVEQGRQRLRMVSASDVLIGRYGASVGRILRGKSGAINVAIVKTLPDESRILSDYLYYLLQGGRFQTFVTSLGGRAAQAGFNKGELNPFPIGLPGIDEQHQIVKVLATLDRKLTAEEQRRDALDVLFSSLLHDLMTARVRVPVGEFAEVTV